MGGKITTINTVIRIKKKGISDLSKVSNIELLPHFTRLTVILLQHNKLSGIPDSVLADVRKSPKLIEYLQVLNLSHNRFRELPAELFLLINLKILKLENNFLSTISSQVFSLCRLEELHLGNNVIEHLPWNFHKLRRLKKLFLESNKINYVPNTIGKLTCLINLSIIPNPLTTINDVDIVLACHNAQFNIVLDFLYQQPIPNDYPYLPYIKYLEEKKIQKLRAHTDDQNLLKKILKTTKGLASMEAFMEKEYSIENLMFWKVIYDYGKTYNSDIEISTSELIEAAKQIFNTYIAEDSKYTINIPADIYSNLRKIFTDTYVYPKGINQWVFKPAIRAILELISRDTFRRFKVTEEGAAIIKYTQERSKKGRKIVIPGGDE